MKRFLVLIALLMVAGCSPKVPKVAVVPTAKPKPIVSIPTAKPTPTMSPRQKRAERRAQRRKERAERRRVAREKAAEKKRLALEQEENERVTAEEQQARDVQAETPSKPSGVLAQLDWKYQENSSQILRMSEKGSEILAEAGLTESPESIMEHVNKVMDKPLLDDQGNNNQKYAEYLAMYITLRKGE